MKHLPPTFKLIVMAFNSPNTNFFELAFTSMLKEKDNEALTLCCVPEYVTDIKL